MRSPLRNGTVPSLPMSTLSKESSTSPFFKTECAAEVGSTLLTITPFWSFCTSTAPPSLVGLRRNPWCPPEAQSCLRGSECLVRNIATRPARVLEASTAPVILAMVQLAAWQYGMPARRTFPPRTSISGTTGYHLWTPVALITTAKLRRKFRNSGLT